MHYLHNLGQLTWLNCADVVFSFCRFFFDA